MKLTPGGGNIRGRHFGREGQFFSFEFAFLLEFWPRYTNKGAMRPAYEISCPPLP